MEYEFQLNYEECFNIAACQYVCNIWNILLLKYYLFPKFKFHWVSSILCGNPIPTQAKM